MIDDDEPMIRTAGPSLTEHRHFTAGQCVNCEGPGVTVTSPLYCSSQCRQAAELVRYVRSCRRDGRDLLPDVAEAIQMRTAMVLGGGYPERERRVPQEVRDTVFRRSGGFCEECGRRMDLGGTTGDPDATPTIQHVGGNSNDLSNLKAFCRRCNMADAQSRFIPVEQGSAEAALAVELRVRWSAPEPMRLCDDDRRWKNIWQGLANDAREVLRLADDFQAGAGDADLPGFRGWTDQGSPIQEF